MSGQRTTHFPDWSTARALTGALWHSIFITGPFSLGVHSVTVPGTTTTTVHYCSQCMHVHWALTASPSLEQQQMFALYPGTLSAHSVTTPGPSTIHYCSHCIPVHSASTALPSLEQQQPHLQISGQTST